MIDNCETCNICHKPTKEIFNLNFRDIIGMAENYTQRINYCTECGFIYTANPFSSEQLERRYKSYSKFEFASDDYVFNEAEDYKKRCYRQKCFINNNTESFKSILEIGSASGFNLSLYPDYINMGIEPSAINCSNAREKYNVEMFNGMFDEYIKKFPQNKYDMIFLSHTLEHIVNPYDFITQCSNINNKYIFIEVPTFDYKFINEPFGMFAEEHVNYFTLEGLSSLMSKAGYRLVNADIILGIEQKLPARWPAISSLWEKTNDKTIKQQKALYSSKQLVKKYIQMSTREFRRIKTLVDDIDEQLKLAVWGTGHHASMLLANTSLINKNIIKFYDSDTRKHHYTMANKPIELFNPEDIMEGRVDAIIIASYTAQQAIEKALQKYKENCTVITLYPNL